MVQVERHLIKSSHKYFKLLKHACVLSKRLYNHANYVVRQKMLSEKQWVRYNELYYLLRDDIQYPDFRNMPTTQCGQQTLRLLDKNWKSFFASIKDWKKNPNKYLGKPKMPKYKRNTQIVILTYQECKIRDKLIKFPKSFNGFTIKPKFIQNDFTKFCQVRIIPNNNEIIIELVYEIADVSPLFDNKRYMGIDLGVNNLATCVSNVNFPILINGRPIKSINQFYNKCKAHLQSRLQKNIKISKRIKRLTSKRNRRIEDSFHKISKFIVQNCVTNQINTIVIGKNNGWKQNSNMSKKNNQNFVSIPFDKLIHMIEYKANKMGITVLQTEESYTSGTSFLDNELPIKENYNKKRRIYRGLFISNNKTKINADVNGAFQILRKVFPNVIYKWDRGCGLQPVLWTASQSIQNK